MFKKINKKCSGWPLIMHRKVQESGSQRPPRDTCKTHTPMMNRVKEIYENKELPLSPRPGIIALIPKRDKDQRFMSNWQPFILRETFYKLISATLSN